MTAELKFIVLDDKAHVIGFSEHTACGLPIPIGESYVFDEPKGLCAQCKKLTEDGDEYGVLKSVIEGDNPPVDVPAPDETPEEPKKADSGKRTKA